MKHPMGGRPVLLLGRGLCRGERVAEVISVAKRTARLQFGAENRGTENGILAYSLEDGRPAGPATVSYWEICAVDLDNLRKPAKTEGER